MKRVYFLWLLSSASLILVISTETFAQWGKDGIGHGIVISSTAGYPVPEHKSDIELTGRDHIFHSSYRAPDHGHEDVPKKVDTIFGKMFGYDDHKHNKYNEKVLRKAYNDYIDNKLALKKRIFTTLVQKTVDKTVDVTASLTKYAVDFITKLSIDTAANVAKNGAHAVIHKKEEKFKGGYYH